MTPEERAQLDWLVERRKKTAAVVEDATTLARVIGKRGLYPSEDEWRLIVGAADAVRDALAALDDVEKA